jgi:Ca-activated chloride channel family protein
VGVEASTDVFVTADGRPVTGLAERDFELRDGGRRREVELVAVESLPLRTYVVLDTSGSVDGEKLRQLQAGVVTLLRGLRPGDEAALVTFDHEIVLRVPPTAELQRLERGVRGILPEGATALYDALYAGTLLAGGHQRSLLVAFSDGEDNLSWLETQELHRVLQESNVLAQVVASVPERPPLPEPAHVRALRRLAEITGGQLWPADSPERLASAFAAILEAMRTRYVLRFEPQYPQRPGLHEIEVRLVRRSGKVHCRRAYFVGPASR